MSPNLPFKILQNLQKQNCHFWSDAGKHTPLKISTLFPCFWPLPPPGTFLCHSQLYDPPTLKRRRHYPKLHVMIEGYPCFYQSISLHTLSSLLFGIAVYRIIGNFRFIWLNLKSRQFNFFWLGHANLSHICYNMRRLNVSNAWKGHPTNLQSFFFKENIQ